MQRKTPTVWVAVGYAAPRADLYDLPNGGSLRVESAAWFTWLAEETTTRFAYALVDPSVGYVRGFLTVRKERRARGDHYWVAYWRIHGRLWKHYLGAGSRLTCASLETLGETALAASQTSAENGGAPRANQPESPTRLEP